MCQPKKWWWGLLPLAVLFGLAMMLTAGPTEGDVAQNAAKSFRDAGLPWAKATLSGRDAIVSGEAPTPESRKLAVDAAQRAWGVRTVADATTVVAEQKPYTASATREGNKITLAGFVPNDEVRADFIKAAKASFPNAEVVDQLKVARGASAVYAPAMAFGAGQLGKLSGGVASLSDSALSITGVAPNFAGLDAVNAAVKALPAGVTLAKAEIAPPTMAPFTWGAVKAGSGVTLSGFIPSEAVRAPMLAAAKAVTNAGNVVDNTRVANGLPSSVNFGQASNFVLDQLAKLRTATGNLSNNGLTFTGEASDVATFEVVSNTLKGTGLPGGLQLASQTITAPTVSPYVWSATRAPGSITLAGSIPSDSLRGGINDAAKKAFPAERIVDEMKAALGAPNGFMDAVNASLAQLARLKTGVVTITNAAMSVTGEAVQAGGADQVRVDLPALPNVVVAIPPASLVVPPAPVVVAPVIAAAPALSPVQVCQAKLVQVLSKEGIRFVTGSATIQTESADLIKALADAVKLCPGFRIEVQGHTDSDGDPGSNMDLSNRRAQAVVERIESLGLDKGRLSAKGFGEANPIVPNDTPENKAKNRRIDFIVQAQ